MFFIKSVWRVRKHETQSYRESCVFHFSHFDLYIYIISKSWTWHFLVDTMSNLDLPSRGLPVIITEESVCMVLSITGNSLVCIAAYRNPNLRSTTNLYIIALAVSDLLCAAFNVYNADHRKMGLWRHLMTNSRLSWCICQLCYPGNPWFDSV